MRDPVCGMSVEKEKAAGQSTVQGCTYYFCSTECKQKFDSNPRAYLSDSSLGA
jgi:P-type Cu+ transporter